MAISPVAAHPTVVRTAPTPVSPGSPTPPESPVSQPDNAFTRWIRTLPMGARIAIATGAGAAVGGAVGLLLGPVGAVAGAALGGFFMFSLTRAFANFT